jgi:hypothetical protein
MPQKSDILDANERTDPAEKEYKLVLCSLYRPQTSSHSSLDSVTSIQNYLLKLFTIPVNPPFSQRPLHKFVHRIPEPQSLSTTPKLTNKTIIIHLELWISPKSKLRKGKKTPKTLWETSSTPKPMNPSSQS